MEKRRRVAVCDNSLYMAGIAASLKSDPTLEVICNHLDSPNSRRGLDVNHLVAIVFDLGDPPGCLDIALLCDQPGLLLIGVDPSRAEMLVLSSHPAQALSVTDLVNVICKMDSTPSSFIGENHEKKFPH